MVFKLWNCSRKLHYLIFISYSLQQHFKNINFHFNNNIFVYEMCFNHSKPSRKFYHVINPQTHFWSYTKRADIDKLWLSIAFQNQFDNNFSTKKML